MKAFFLTCVAVVLAAVPRPPPLKAVNGSYSTSDPFIHFSDNFATSDYSPASGVLEYIKLLDSIRKYRNEKERGKRYFTVGFRRARMSSIFKLFSSRFNHLSVLYVSIPYVSHLSYQVSKTDFLISHKKQVSIFILSYLPNNLAEVLSVLRGTSSIVIY